MKVVPDAFEIVASLLNVISPELAVSENSVIFTVLLKVMLPACVISTATGSEFPTLPSTEIALSVGTSKVIFFVVSVLESIVEAKVIVEPEVKVTSSSIVTVF